MSLVMPELNQKVLSRRDDIIRGLRRIVPGEGVITAATELRPYESDGFTAYRQPPMVVVLPETAAQVSAVLAFCHEEDVRVVPRGSGTSLSGGALPLADGVLLGLGKFNCILDINYGDRLAVVQPEVTNLAITQAVQGAGFYYAPDPSRSLMHWGGYATLVRAPKELRAVIPMQHPRPRGVMALEARVRRAFDPSGVFESGRFLDHNDAN
jgi:glycolate oxidase